MQLYTGTSQDFILEATRNKIALTLENAFIDIYRYRPSRQEIQSWQNSLFRMSYVLQAGDFIDHGILLEYQLPLSSRRLDCMITGYDMNNIPHGVIVELKQWSDVEPSNAEDCVVTWVGGGKKDVLHPSRQVGQYEEYLCDMDTVFTNQTVQLRSCAYLHNINYSTDNEIFSNKHTNILEKYPVFAGDQETQLQNFLKLHIGNGNGYDVLKTVIRSKYKPSKKLLEHTSNVIDSQKTFVLIDNQYVVFNKVLAEVQSACQHPKKKTVFLIKGGPGTGKSVIALHLLGRLSGDALNVMHLTGSKAFTENLRKTVGSRASAQFGYFNINKKGTIPINHFDALILDEAHRIRETSKDRFTKQADWSGIPQIEEIINTTKVSVFFIDDMQIVRPGEVGTTELIRETAKKLKANLLEYELESQFRCSGADGFINWIDNTLSIRSTANILWKKNDPYEVRIVDTVNELEALMRDKNKENQTARLVSGFCWPWSDPNSDGTLFKDICIGDWSMPWNAKPDGKRLAKNIPKSNFWASDPNGINQVGCVYTVQGFEVDYIGVIFGLDLRYDWKENGWVGDKSYSHDTVVKRSKDQFLELVKNTYRVLLTRGIKGCYIYFMDDETRKFFQSRME